MRKLLLLLLISGLTTAHACVQTSTGDAILINGLYYFLNTTQKTACATFKPDNPFQDEVYTGDITVPEKVTYKGTEYTVNEIGSNAFESQYNVTSIDFPATITKVGMMALYKNVSLNSFVCRAVVPPATSTDIESFDYSICTEVPLYVPAESVEAYKQADTWKQFRYILPLGSASITVDNDLWYILYSNYNTATFVGPRQYTYYTGELVIPSTVPYETEDGNQVYTVTAVDDNALTYQWDITSVVLPATIESLGAAVFEGCNSMTKLTCQSATPPTAQTGASAPSPRALRANAASAAAATFSSWFFDNVQLHVPSSSIETYKSTEPWRNFKTIVGFVPTSIENAAAYDMGFSISGNCLYANGKCIKVYDISGRIVYNGSNAIVLQNGIYIVQTGGRSVKVQI